MALATATEPVAVRVDTTGQIVLLFPDIREAGGLVASCRNGQHQPANMGDPSLRKPHTHAEWTQALETFSRYTKTYRGSFYLKASL